jgi:hypothetical protein
MACFTLLEIMNIELKSAWYTVVVVGTALVSCLIMGAMSGFPAAFAPLSSLGLLGILPLLFGRKNGCSGCDERDVAIVRKATLIGGMCSYMAVVVGGMLIWFIQFSRGSEYVTIHALPGLVVVAAIVLFLARSVFIISQYTPKSLGSNE